MDKIDPQSKNRFIDQEGVFKMSTDTITKLGMNGIGRKLLTVPKISVKRSAIESTTEDEDIMAMVGITNGSGTLRSISHQDLCTFYAKKIIVKTTFVNGKEIKYIDATGSLDNIKVDAKISFGNDKDQEVAFIHATTAFVFKLHEKILTNGA